jgi:uncharacterized protein YdaU (DUF1376 family)
MSAQDLPIMPLFVKDWLGATLHWTDAERGAYMSLLVFQWVNNKVPADTAQLARIMGTPEREFEARWSRVGVKFDGDQSGLFNNRLEEHRKKALQLRDKRAFGATVANAHRRAKRTAERNAEPIAEHDAERISEHHAPVTPTSTSTSTSSEEKNKRASLRSAHAQRASRGTPWNDDEWINFKLEYPHRIGGVQWARAMKSWKARLAEGHTWQELLEGARRYRMYCDAAGKSGTEYVMHASTFCGPDKGFTQEWEIPADASSGETWVPPEDETVDPP